MKKLLIFLLVFSAFSMQTKAQSISLYYDEGAMLGINANPKLAESNLDSLIVAVNTACSQKAEEVNLSDIGISEFGKNSIQKLWNSIHFSFETKHTQEKLWIFKKRRIMQVFHLPLYIENDTLFDGKRQEAQIEFDFSGRIVDFRLAADAGVDLNPENIGDVAELENQLVIWKYVEWLRTAYVNKDIDFMNQVFSDDAIIISATERWQNDPERGIKRVLDENRRTKTEYLKKLEGVFKSNEWIKVTFSAIDAPEMKNGSITFSTFVDKRISPSGRIFYGVRVRQEWTSPSYSDDGYVFMLWEFPEGKDPVIHVRTWQSAYTKDIRGKKIATDLDNVYSLKDFDQDIIESDK